MSTGYDGKGEEQAPTGPPKVAVKRIDQWPSHAGAQITTTILINDEACGMIRFAHQDDFTALKKCLMAGGLWDDR